MNKLERQFEPRPNFENLDEKLSNHGLETKESLRLRSEIKKFFETRHLAISQELGTANFSIIIGGSIQAGTADERSDVDLTIILDIDVNTIRDRIARRKVKHDRYENKDDQYHENVAIGYREIAKKYPERCTLIDATQSIETIQEIIQKTLAEKLR